MTIDEAMKTFRLPNPTTQEYLECRWSKVLAFGNKVLLAGHHYQHGGPCYYSAVYEHLDSDMSCEGPIGLRAVSEVVFTTKATRSNGRLSKEGNTTIGKSHEPVNQFCWGLRRKVVGSGFFAFLLRFSS